ncbi:hypothetical protein CYMTET_20174, partial [Cymbomonas tetramitiformis]
MYINLAGVVALLTFVPRRSDTDLDTEVQWNGIDEVRYPTVDSDNSKEYFSPSVNTGWNSPVGQEEAPVDLAGGDDTFRGAVNRTDAGNSTQNLTAVAIGISVDITTNAPTAVEGEAGEEDVSPPLAGATDISAAWELAPDTKAIQARLARASRKRADNKTMVPP